MNMPHRTWLALAASALSGLVFSLGLGLSGMTQPARVLGFLNVQGHWNPSLMLVMAGAIGVAALFFRQIKKQSAPLLDQQFHLAPARRPDMKLITGSALFGIGWGWSGICPGPAMVALATGHYAIIVFVLSMLAGMWMGNRINAHLES